MTWCHRTWLSSLNWSKTPVRFCLSSKMMPNNKQCSTQLDFVYCTGQRPYYNFCLSSKQWHDVTELDCTHCTGQCMSLGKFCLSLIRWQTMVWRHIAWLYMLYLSTTILKFLFVYKRCLTMLWHHMAWLYVLHCAMTWVKFFFVFKTMPNTSVKPNSMIVLTALVNVPSEIFVCLQKDFKQCCDVT